MGMADDSALAIAETIARRSTSASSDDLQPHKYRRNVEQFANGTPSSSIGRTDFVKQNRTGHELFG
jgi:hypothetical protein